MTDALPFLDEEHAKFITDDGMTVNAASVGRDGFGNLARCVGCRVNAARDQITLVLAATPAAAFLADIQRNGRVAVVFCEPHSHRTVQFKGSDARQGVFPHEEIGRVQRYREALAEKLLRYGEPIEVTLAMLDAPADDLVTVTFTPQAAFSQTPGGNAGNPLQFAS